MGNSFKPYMGEIVSIASEVIKTAKPHVCHTNNNMFSLDTDSEDEDVGELYVDQNVIEEINAAIHCLGQIAVACPVEYTSYLKDTIMLLENLQCNYDDSVRS
mmetsp:Transcript_35850/g.32247  ORF Transcript_35850/g.32247 Transcript_35850/m.32247 type:complete len:102 (-) Transcript_35850:12-317(-)